MNQENNQNNKSTLERFLNYKKEIATWLLCVLMVFIFFEIIYYAFIYTGSENERINNTERRLDDLPEDH